MTILAKTMLEETPLVPRIVSHNDPLIQGIIFLLTFMGPFTCLTFYGHNRAQLTAERQGMEQTFETQAV